MLVFINEYNLGRSDYDPISKWLHTFTSSRHDDLAIYLKLVNVYLEND